MKKVCPFCIPPSPRSDLGTKLIRHGSFFRKSDQAQLIRYKCLDCGKTFSQATGSLCYRQKKRHLNPHVFKFLASNISQRRLALTLGVNRKTIVRKFLFLSYYADLCFQQTRDDFYQNSPVMNMQFDDMETFEHSKLKPLSITLAVENKTRRILGFRVSEMPAKGLLVQKSLKKYGKRQDERRENRRSLFKELGPFLSPGCIIESDENPHYRPCVEAFFPRSRHKAYKGRRGCVVGQGELKAGGYDPLFTLNHTCAMLRDNINRLVRRTWATTKKKERLELHIKIYALYHNLVLINK